MTFITNNLNILSSGQDQISKLKSLVLKLAVTGKLVQFSSNDEEALSLLKELREQKAELYSKKLIRKEKSLDKITDDELYFKAPNHWQWCRLNELCIYIQRGKSPKYTETSSIPIISQKCVQWDGFKIDRARFLDTKVIDKYGPERFVRDGDLLWNSTGHGTLGRLIVYKEKYSPYEKIVADSHVTVIRPFTEKVLSDYLFYWFASPFVQGEINDRATGTTKQIELNTSTVKNYLVPLPPTEEQHRIVQKVNTLFAQIDQLAEHTEKAEHKRQQLRKVYLHQLEQAPSRSATESAWQQLEQQFDLAIRTVDDVQALRQTILQLAVKGQLVEQDAAGEPASVLLERIKAEKAQLVKSGKIRKPKALAPVSEEEVPFAVPEGWVWCRFQEICLKITDGFHNTPKKISEGYPYILSTHVKPDKIDWSNCFYVSEKDHKELFNKTFPERGDILVVNIGAGCATPAIIDVDFEFSFKNTAILKRAKVVCEEYLFYYLLMIKDNVFKEVTQGGAQPYLSLKMIRNLIFPFPPVKEQERIISKIKSLFTLCDQLEAKLRAREAKREKLVGVVLRG
jgi:type I restriction enzyme S subunit